MRDATSDDNSTIRRNGCANNCAVLKKGVLRTAFHKSGWTSETLYYAGFCVRAKAQTGQRNSVSRRQRMGLVRPAIRREKSSRRIAAAREETKLSALGQTPCR
jgi:hypothetical protein